MIRKLYPNAYSASIFELMPEYFQNLGIKGVIFDLDNTITPWHSKELEDKSIHLIERFLESGLRVCILSNALSKRVERMLLPLGVPGIAKARKPSRRAFQRAMEILGTTIEETAVVGDQVFTDIYGGNRMGLHTILVRPMSKKEFIGTKFVRYFERRLLINLNKKGLLRAPK